MQTPRGEIRDEILELLKHEDVLRKMSETKSPEECYEVAKPIVGDIGLEEFALSMTAAKAYLDDQENGVLTEEDLEMIAGGKSQEESDDITSYAVTGGIMAGVCVAAGSAAAA